MLGMAWRDWRKREIWLIPCICLALAAAAWRIWMAMSGAAFPLEEPAAALLRAAGEMALAAVPGIILLILSRVSAGAVGEGDGYFMISAGLCLGIRQVMELFFFGVMLCGLYCLGALCVGAMRGRDMRSAAVPFLPFMVPVWICMMFR